MRFAVDTGGTFTDLVVEERDGTIFLYKTATTPHDPTEGILNVLEKAAQARSLNLKELLLRGEAFIHGTTHAINAVITGKTARTAFLTTRGHPDILVFREGGRSEPFNYSVPYPKPYVPRSLTFEVPERICADGSIREPLDEAEVARIIEKLREKKVSAVGVCLLWSTVNPIHEKRVAELLAKDLPGVPVTLSHELNPILREYRRASSTCIDASFKPLMSRYLGGLAARLRDEGFQGRLLMLTSKGGIMDFNDLAEAPIHCLGSGPSMAPIAGRYYAKFALGADTAIVADTGGTTYDVSLVRRASIPMTNETWIGKRYLGHLTGFPSVDVKSIGAGGGSIARVDEGGMLHVGPESAGAVPGPACYGKGGARPTVTDACVVLGYIDPDFFLGGEMKLQVEPALRAVEEYVGKPLGLDRYQSAAAILHLATENMVGAIEQITIYQGMDTRGTVLIGGGGAAGLNSVEVARRLGCAAVIFPDTGATLSAAGAIMSDLHADYRGLLFTSTDQFDYEGVNAVLRKLYAKCRAFLQGPGMDSLSHAIELHTEARYRSQIWEIDVPLTLTRFESPEDLRKVREDFDQAHEQLFAFKDQGSDVQFVGWRATVRCRIRDKEIGHVEIEKSNVRRRTHHRKAYFERSGLTDARVELLEALSRGSTVEGPAIIETALTTIVVDPDAKARIHDGGCVIVTPQSHDKDEQ